MQHRLMFCTSSRPERIVSPMTGTTYESRYARVQAGVVPTLDPNQGSRAGPMTPDRKLSRRKGRPASARNSTGVPSNAIASAWARVINTWRNRPASDRHIAAPANRSGRGHSKGPPYDNLIKINFVFGFPREGWASRGRGK